MSLLALALDGKRGGPMELTVLLLLVLCVWSRCGPRQWTLGTHCIANQQASYQASYTACKGPAWTS